MSGLEIGLIVACAFLCVLLFGAIQLTNASMKLLHDVGKQRDDYMRTAEAQSKVMADQRSIMQKQRSIMQKQQELLRERA